MGVTGCTNRLEWELVDLQCDHVTQRIVPDGEDPTSMRFYRGVRYVLTWRQRCLKVTAFAESCGQTKTIFTFNTGSVTQVTWGSTGRKFICISDTLTPSETIVDECINTQVWQHEGDWEEIPAADYIST